MEFPRESKNWFSLSEKDGYRKVYAHSEFCDQLSIQIKRKLGVDINNNCKALQESYYFHDFKILIEEHNFNNLCCDHSILNNNLYPFLTFYSTQDISKINCITKYGYLVPNEIHRVFGWRLQMRTG